MKHLGLFEGIGGFSLAARWMGWETVAWVEINKFCQQVLKKNFPEAKGYGDIKEFNGTPYRGAIDILTGGDPCQGNSTAGKGEGKEYHNYLWPEYFRIVREAQPSCVVNENVSGSIPNRILDQKISDLESEGYTCWPPLCIPSGALGAQHRRDRVLLVAYSNAFGSQTFSEQLAGCVSSKINESKSTSAIDSLYGAFIPSGSIEQLFTDEPPLSRVYDGLPKELDAIAALGNSIDPRLAFEIFKAIEQVRNERTPEA